jgi:hypothetical protein
MWGNGPEI